MLEQMRSASKSWVATLLIGMLILSFAIWGINDIFTGGQATQLAKVGDETLDARDFDQEFTTAARNLTNERGQRMTPAEARAQGYDRIVLDGMISDLAMLNESKKMSLAASDDMVREAIGSIPGMRGGDGAIDPSRFAQILRELGLTEAQFVERVRTDLMSQQLTRTAAIGAPAPRGMTLALQAYEHERRTIDYVVLTPEHAGEIAAPDDAALQAFIDEHPEAYTAPELRSFTLLAVGPDDLVGDIELTDAEIAAEYEAQKASFETVETRALQQIVYPSKEEAEAARKAIEGGESFEAAAAKRNLTADDISLGDIRKGDPAFPASAFEIAEGAVTQPEETAFGWSLVKVIKIHPGSVKPLDEVKGQIREEMARDRAIVQIGEMANRFQDAVFATDALDDAARDLGLTARKIEGMDAQGRDADGKPIEGLPDGAEFLEGVFQLEVGDKSDVSETQGHVLYVVHMDGVTPPTKRPLGDVRDQAVEAWTLSRRLNALMEKSNAAATAAAESGAAIDKVAADLGAPAKQLRDVSRDTASTDLSEAFLAQLFATPEGQWLAGAGSTAPNMVVARVSAVSSGAPASAAERTDEERELRGDLTRALSSDFVSAYRAAILAGVEVTVNEKLFELTRTRGQ